jgi:hypothetical protein
MSEEIKKVEEETTPIAEKSKVEEAVKPAKAPKSKVEEAEYVCPLTVNYKELEEALKGKSITDYVGDKLPKEQVEAIEADFKIYQSKNK